MDIEEKQFLKNLYREAKLAFEKDYFKSILNLSAGALALSITVAQLAFTTEINRGWILMSSWLLLGISVISVLVYFKLGQYEYDKRIEKIDRENAISKINEKERKELMELTDAVVYGKKIQELLIRYEEIFKRTIFKWLGGISIIAFILGITFLAIFTYVNLLSS